MSLNDFMMHVYKEKCYERQENILAKCSRLSLVVKIQNIWQQNAAFNQSETSITENWIIKQNSITKTLDSWNENIPQQSSSKSVVLWLSDMVLKELFCPYTGLTVRTCTATKTRHATSRSQKPFWRSWTLRMQSCTWTLLCWASSLCRSVWSPTSSSDTRSVLRGRLVEDVMERVTVETFLLREG